MTRPSSSAANRLLQSLRPLLLGLPLLLGVLALQGCNCTGPGTDACISHDCADIGANCGEIDDGCGGTILCGFCGGGMTCGGGGVANVCGGGTCSPLTCTTASAECGLLPDGCGGSSICGVCGGGELCGGGGRAFECGITGACEPIGCLEAGVDCGRIPDGCGGVVDCTRELGACADGEYCGGAGANRCGGADGTCVPRTCVAGRCGQQTDGCADVLDCGGCDTGLLCAQGSCVAAADDVGDACTSDAQCLPGVCLTAGTGWPGGYCTTHCETDGECGAGNICAFTGGADPGVCVATCVGSLDCTRSGYQCLPVPGGTGTACLPTDLPDPTCEALTCATAGAECGRVADGCGGTLDCGTGTCGAGEFCGGGGPNQCGTGTSGGSCTPSTCTAADCGYVADGCADVLSCGGCEGGQLCRPSGQCVDAAGDVGLPCTSDAQCATGVCLTSGSTSWPGGYCTTWCTSDADCGTGNSCSELEANGRGVCVETCFGDNDCPREGYICSGGTCGPGGTGTGDLGDACDSVADCAGGADAICVQTSPDQPGTCSVRCGSTSPPCPAGSHCAYTSAGNGACAIDCTSQANCPAGQICTDRDHDGRTECGPGGGIGEPCATDADCVTGTCITQAESGMPGGYCTSGCSSDADCGDGGRCVQLNGAQQCAQGCTSSRDCRGEGYACYAPDGGDPVCLPYGTGTGDVGDSCTTTADCDGGAAAICLSTPSGGQCSLGCESAADCPPGADCTTGEDGHRVCRQTCASTADCHENHTCEDGLCVPEETTGGSGEPGDPCTDSQQCLGSICMIEEETGWRDGLCTGSCASNDDCGAGSHCSIFQTTSVDGQSYSVGMCYQDCSSNADCRQGYACWDSNDDGINECAAYASGTDPIGDGCVTVDECAGGERGECMVRLDGYPEGYCSMDCTTGGCPSGSTCTKGKLCMDNVCCPGPDRAEGGCAAGTAVKPALLLHDDTGGGFCVATARTWTRCDSTPDCGSGEVCQGGYCHRPATCSESSSWSWWSGCPGGSLCHGGVCVRPRACEDGCPAGSSCWGNYCAQNDVSCAADPETQEVAECPAGTVCSTDGPGGTACIVVSNLGCSNSNPCPVSRGWWDTGDSSVCFTDYCVDPNASCSKSRACPNGFICTNDTGGRCVKCDGDRCRDNYECGDLDGDAGRECWPAAKGGGAPGDPCDSLDDCSGGILGRCIFEDVRLDEFRGGYCVWDCGGVSCPSGSTCITINSGSDEENTSKWCLKSCSTDAQCRAGYKCYAVGDGSAKTCFPSDEE